MIPASSAVAPTVPSRVYIWPANNGKAAANEDRANALAAIADAAIGRYATTRYVNVPLKQRMKPAPKPVEAMMGTIQCTDAYVVKASQNMLMGTMTAPILLDKRQASGVGGVPTAAYFFIVCLWRVRDVSMHNSALMRGDLRT